MSDSDRIALAASVASHNTKSEYGGRSRKKDFRFSVDDAEASAIRFGVVTVMLRITGRGLTAQAFQRNLNNWVGSPSFQVLLNVDGTTVRPMSNGEYFAALVPFVNEKTVASKRLFSHKVR